MSTAPQHGFGRGAPHPPKCADCGDTGFRPAPQGKGVLRCDCVRQMVPRHELPVSAHQIRALVGHWLRSQRGPMGEPLTGEEAEILEILRNQVGQKNAISIIEIQHSAERSDRHIKQMVRMLRVKHRIKVGSLRGHARRSLGAGAVAESKVHGYFLCLTPREVDVTISARLAEVRSSLEVINALKGGLSHALAEVNGQLRLLFGGSSANG